MMIAVAGRAIFFITHALNLHIVRGIIKRHIPGLNVGSCQTGQPLATLIIPCPDSVNRLPRHTFGFVIHALLDRGIGYWLLLLSPDSLVIGV